MLYSSSPLPELVSGKDISLPPFIGLDELGLLSICTFSYSCMLETLQPLGSKLKYSLSVSLIEINKYLPAGSVILIIGSFLFFKSLGIPCPESEPRKQACVPVHGLNPSVDSFEAA